MKGIILKSSPFICVVCHAHTHFAYFDLISMFYQHALGRSQGLYVCWTHFFSSSALKSVSFVGSCAVQGDDLDELFSHGLISIQTCPKLQIKLINIIMESMLTMYAGLSPDQILNMISLLFI